MFKLLSINSRGFDRRKENLIFDYVRSSDVDVCFVQEVLLSDSSFFRSLASRWRGPCFLSPSTGRQGGTLTLLSQRFDASVLSWRKDTEGRVVSLLVQANTFKRNLVNIYAPTCLTDRKDFFDNLHEFFLPADAIILGGDFNGYESELDKHGGVFSPSKFLSDFCSAFRLVDIFRKLHPRTRECSWFNADFSIGSRLDKFFISSNFVRFAQSCHTWPCCFSDHDFVNLHLILNNDFPRGPGLWKFNNSLLQDLDFCSLSSDRINDLSSCIDSFPSVKLWWDFLKRSLQAEIISFASEKRRNLNHDRVVVINRLISCKRRLVQGDDSVVAEIVALESQLKSLILRDLEGVKTRSRAQWLEEGEKPTRFFFKLERERAERNSLSSILDSDGVEVFSRGEIERAHLLFYAKLFSPEPIDGSCKQQLLRGFSSSLSEADRALCDDNISLAELAESLGGLSLNKSPGPDGFTVEFFSKFWHLLGPYFLQLVGECLRDNVLPQSMKGSATRLIYKKRGDKRDLKNWRPISLLNVAYKILSKVFTTRLSRVLSSVVHPDQTCSVPGRSISSNVVMLRDILDYIERTDEAAILVSLDQEKAFDRVDRSFLSDLLCHLGFGPIFRKWVSTLYEGAFMQIILNGWLTEEIPLRHGVRQGDPLSPLLYVLCVEALACQIRNCPEIRGFLLSGARGRQAKARIYADDTTTILKDLFSLRRLFDLISVYERGSGAKLNRSKTEAMWLGSWKSRTDEPLGLTWVRKMKVLGVVFGTIPVEIDNWQPKLEKLEKTLNLWKSRSLSFVGKALIVNVLGFSKLFYLGRFLLLPAWVLARVNQLIWGFLWGSRMETISRNTCSLDVKVGGLSICNLQLKCQALLLSLIVSTISNSDDSSFFLCKYFIGRRLSSMRVEWAGLRDVSSPSSASPTPFYDSCLRLLLELSRVPDLTSRKIYAHLLSTVASPPVLPFEWSSFVPSNFSLARHWSLVRDSFSENFKNDLLWLITLRGVKVRSSLRSWGYIGSDICASCPRRETIDHCFLHCPRVKKVWTHFRPFLSLILQTNFTVNLLFVFFFLWPSTSAKRAKLARLLVKSILYGIWTFRNKSTFHNGTEDHRAIIRYVSSDLKRRVSLDFLRFSESRFSDCWILENVCAMENGFPRLYI